MSAGKRPYPRYRVINECLTSKYQRYWSLRELMDKLEAADLFVKKRALQYDLEAMRFDEQLGYLAPIAYCPRNRGYYYTDPNYSIDVVPLNVDDLRSLTFAVNVLKRYKGAQVVRQFEGTLDKVSKIVHQLKKGDSVKRMIVGFEKAPYNKGMDYFDQVLQAVDEKQVLYVGYKKFSDKETDTHQFHPYLLKEYQGRWYVLGFSDERNAVITLALDRIEFLKEALIPFRQSTGLNEQEYFNHTIGITHTNEDVQEIVLKFSPFQAAYVKTQHLHHSQRTVNEDEDGLTISLQLKPNYELISLLLSYGAEVEVLKPMEMRQKLQSVYKRCSKLE